MSMSTLQLVLPDDRPKHPNLPVPSMNINSSSGAPYQNWPTQVGDGRW